MIFSVEFNQSELELLRASLRRYAQQLEREGFICDDVIALRIKVSNILNKKIAEAL